MSKQEQALVTEQEATFGGDNFQKMLETLSSIVDEVCLKVEKDGIRVACVDPAHISMFQVFAPKEAFTGWQTSGEMEVGLDLGTVITAIKRCKYASTTKVKVKGRKVIVSGSSKRFTLATIDTTGMSTPKIPDLSKQLTVEYELSKEKLSEAVKDAGWMTDHISFVVKGGELYATGHGEGDTASYENPIGKAIGGDCKSTYPLDYVAKLAKAIPSKAKVKMGNDYPIRFDWQTDEYDYQGKLRQKGISYTFLLAPRIEADDDEPQPSKPVKEATPPAEEYEDEDVVTDECDECDICDESEESEEDYSEEEAVEAE